MCFGALASSSVCHHHELAERAVTQHTGPHGAGLTNMVFAPRNASVVELSLKPNCNRCFGYMAMSLGLDYWMVPQISSHYEGFYEMTDDGAQSIVTLIKKILLLPSQNKVQNQAEGMIEEKKISKKLQYHPADMIPRNMKVCEPFVQIVAFIVLSLSKIQKKAESSRKTSGRD